MMDWQNVKTVLNVFSLATIIFYLLVIFIFRVFDEQDND